MNSLLKLLIPISLRPYLHHALNFFYGLKIDDRKSYVESVKDKCGLEVGGPSPLFKSLLPIYQSLKTLSFANFSNETIWEGKLSHDVNYHKNKLGKQYITEATDLSQFADNHFDFIISSNCLEHVANPLKAIFEWKRVGSGNIILVLPSKNNNFDHRRPVTTFDHLLEDYNNDIDEDDLQALDEILALHDLSRDKPAGSYEEFKKRSLNNYKNRCLHHHVFDPFLVKQIASFAGLEITTQDIVPGNYIFLLRTSN
ncbi:class I SAM-dependent methyltransferase [Gammaproteobacteria bacterium]|nr:class I SAM-dependent methyltransferase [Gammaproteobacteria bacterium]